MNELHLFVGGGGGVLGGILCGNTCVCAVEIEHKPRAMLLQRQRDGILPQFPIWDDVCTFDGNPWRGKIDVVCGGFPCQDISSAGKGVGITGARSGLWKEFARIINEIRPRYALVENSPMLTVRGLGVVLGDLAEMGYNAKWGVLGADDAGAPHRRDRIWILATDPHGEQCGQERSESEGQLGAARSSDGGNDVADTEGRKSGEQAERKRGENTCGGSQEIGYVSDPEKLAGDGERNHGASDTINRKKRIQEPPGGVCSNEFCDPTGSGLQDGGRPPLGEPGTVKEFERPAWWATEPGLGGMADGVANRMDQHGLAPGEQVPRVACGIKDRVARLKAIGNGQVPACLKLAWDTLKTI